MADVEQIAAQVADDVRTALTIEDPEERTAALEAIAAAVIALAVADGTIPEGEDAESVAAAFLTAMAPAIGATTTDADAEAVAYAFAHAAVNHAVIATAGPDAKVTWHTMMDDRVRDLHRPLEGVTQAVGHPFTVGSAQLLYPGQPVGPPEGWINCRCSLSVTAAVDPTFPAAVTTDTMSGQLTIVAASDTPWSNFSASDYTIEQWRKACLLKMPGGDPEAKSTYKLPVREPGGALNRGGVHAAAAALAGARGGIKAPASAIAAAKSKLRGLYKQLGEDPPESLAAALPSAAPVDALIAVDTHDAPGWVTNPKETQRLRNYWTKGAGAAKIRWGMPGDFNRCRKQLAKYVTNPEWLAGTCSNLHFVALGFWPGQGPHASIDPKLTPIGEAVTAAFADVADVEVSLPPREWFENPGFTAATPLQVDGDRVLGHLATWGTCHVGIEGACTEAPRSRRDYAYFRTGEVETASGSVNVGQITMDTGHAPREADPHATVAHYDNTGTVVADVAAGEDDHGIWVAGSLRPGVTEPQRRALRAGALSGDWRRIAGNLELVAALVVNVPGFPIPRAEMAASLDVPLSLVAAAIVVVDPNAERIADLVVAKMTSREQDARLHERVARLQAAAKHERVEAILAAVEV